MTNTESADIPSILLVDEEKINRDVLSQHLDEQGYHTVMVETGPQALEKLNSQRFDLVLLDIMMSEMDGYEVLKYLKNHEEFCHIPIIMISAMHDMDKVIKCIEMGAVDYLFKPFNPVLLRARIISCLGRKKLHDQEPSYLEPLEENNKKFERENQELRDKSLSLENLSGKLAKYLPSHVYNSIFSEQQDVKLESHREKMTVLFSRISGFYEMTDTMESESLTLVLNDYLNHMSSIAKDYGGIIERFVGDSIVIFFDESEGKSVQENAVSCVKMAIEMQECMIDLRKKWDSYGISELLRIRIGINTGYCTVGNFGPEDRMNYTIIGGEVNLAHQIESHAQPEEILISHETHALVRKVIHCKKRDTISVKGVASPIQTYEAIASSEQTKKKPLSSKNQILEEQGQGFSFFLNLDEIPKTEKGPLQDFLKSLLAKSK